MKLHVGCGTRILPGYVNIDIVDYNGIDYQCRADKLDGIVDGVVDEIYASHVLDHTDRNTELDATLDEFWRVLKHGGKLYVAVSDFEHVAHMYNEGIDLERLWGHIVGGHKEQYDAHGCVFDFNLLRKYLEKHGFIDVKRYRWQDYLPAGFDDLSQSYIPHMDKENGFLMSLNVVATKP